MSGPDDSGHPLGRVWISSGWQCMCDGGLWRWEGGCHCLSLVYLARQHTHRAKRPPLVPCRFLGKSFDIETFLHCWVPSLPSSCNTICSPLDSFFFCQCNFHLHIKQLGFETHSALQGASHKCSQSLLLFGGCAEVVHRIHRSGLVLVICLGTRFLTLFLLSSCLMS